MDLSKELSDNEVLKIAGNNTKVMLYTDLYKYKDLDAVFGKYKKIILLYIHDRTGNTVSGHWTAMIKQPDRIEHFDSYGLLPDEILYRYKSKAERAKTNQPKNYLTTLLYTYTKLPIHYNQYKYQQLKDNVNSCGYHTAIRCRYSKIPLEEYQKIFNTFKKNKINTDELVVMLGNQYLKK